MAIIQTIIGDKILFISDSHHYLKDNSTGEVKDKIEISVDKKGYVISELEEIIKG